MDVGFPQVVEGLMRLAMPITLIVGLSIGGWVLTTWLRIKNGYPLEGTWGNSIYPKSNDETIERVKLLSQENAQLRAELGAMKDRLVVVERIVTDGGHRLADEIENLRRIPN